MQNAVTLVVGIVAGLALIALGVRWAEDRQSKKAPRPTPAEPKNWFRHLQSKTPALVGEVGTYLIAGGIGALLAWYGAVSASFQPHKLHYVAAASVIAVGAVVVGVILRVVGGKDNALIRELRAEIERLWAALAPKGAASWSTVPGVAASVGATGATGPIPLPGPQSSTGPQGPAVSSENRYISGGIVGGIIRPLGSAGPTGPQGGVSHPTGPPRSIETTGPSSDQPIDAQEVKARECSRSARTSCRRSLCTEPREVERDRGTGENDGRNSQDLWIRI